MYILKPDKNKVYKSGITVAGMLLITLSVGMAKNPATHSAALYRMNWHVTGLSFTSIEYFRGYDGCYKKSNEPHQ